jgi:hypothetical protein
MRVPYGHLTNFFNTSPFVSGCVMLMMNLGGKYVMMDIPNAMNSFFAHSIIRKLTVLCIAFIATRNIKTALLVALLFVLFSKFLMNEKSKCCLPFVKNTYHKSLRDKQARSSSEK